MAKRRGPGEGGIYERDDGRWEAKVSAGVDERGRRLRVSVYGASHRDVAEKLRELASRASTGALRLELANTRKLMFGPYLREWVRNAAAAGEIRESTRVRYVSALKHVTLFAPGEDGPPPKRVPKVPNLGIARVDHIPLLKLTALELQRLYTQLAEAKVPARTRAIVHTVIHAALAAAVKARVIALNPADGVTRPKAKPKKQMRTWSPEQAQAFLAQARDDRLEAMYVLALATGMNQAEIFGLTPGAVDLERGTVRVEQQLIEVRGRLSIGDVKKEKRRRTIAIPAIAVDALRRHNARRLAEGHRAAELLFTDTDGGGLRKSNFARRSFHPLMAAAKVPRIGFHELRHSHATLLLDAGEHVKAISERLGHASTDITLRLYSHVTEGRDRGAADRIGDVLGRKDKPGA